MIYFAVAILLEFSFSRSNFKYIYILPSHILCIKINLFYTFRAVFLLCVSLTGVFTGCNLIRMGDGVRVSLNDPRWGGAARAVADRSPPARPQSSQRQNICHLHRRLCTVYSLIKNMVGVSWYSIALYDLRSIDVSFVHEGTHCKELEDANLNVELYGAISRALESKGQRSNVNESSAHGTAFILLQYYLMCRTYLIS